MKKIKQLSLVLFIFSTLALSYLVTSVSAISDEPAFRSGRSAVDKDPGFSSHRSKGEPLGIAPRKDRMEMSEEDERRLGAKGRPQRNDRMEMAEEDERRF